MKYSTCVHCGVEGLCDDSDTEDTCPTCQRDIDDGLLILPKYEADRDDCEDFDVHEAGHDYWLDRSDLTVKS